MYLFMYTYILCKSTYIYIYLCNVDNFNHSDCFNINTHSMNNLNIYENTIYIAQLKFNLSDAYTIFDK